MDTYESIKGVLTGVVRSYLKSGSTSSEEQVNEGATELVETFERLALQQSFTTGGMPEFPKLKAGDELLRVTPKTRYREREFMTVRVVRMARYRVTVEGLVQSTGRQSPEDFDVRTRHVWDNTPASRRMSSASGPRLYTHDQWAYQLRAVLADQYLKERGLYVSSVRGPLARLYHEDLVGFANALRALEGLVAL